MHRDPPAHLRVVRSPHSSRAKQRRLGVVALRNGLTVLTGPLIYALLVPLVLLDVAVSAFQTVTFPIYGVARVPRRRYFVFDRHKLRYLTFVDRINCSYCSYANGLIAYVREVAARTEQYWCAIKHDRTVLAPHERYRRFAAYGDAADYGRRWPALRNDLRSLRPRPRRHAGRSRRARCRKSSTAGERPVNAPLRWHST